MFHHTLGDIVYLYLYLCESVERNILETMGLPLLGGIQEVFVTRHGASRDDFVDRLNRFYAVATITIMPDITMASVYFKRLITCTTLESSHWQLPTVHRICLLDRGNY